MKNHLTTFLVFLAAFLTPIQQILLAIGFFVIVDVATGIWASVKEGKRITSDRFGRTVTKSIVYLTALVVAQVAQQHIFQATVPIVTVVAGFIASTELLSVGENLTRISGINFRDIFKRLRSDQANKEER